MTTLTQKDTNMLANQLSMALVKFSNKKLPEYQASVIADVALRNVDFSNSTLGHKGINWYAKELLKKINM